MYISNQTVWQKSAKLCCVSILFSNLNCKVFTILLEKIKQRTGDSLVVEIVHAAVSVGAG